MSKVLRSGRANYLACSMWRKSQQTSSTTTTTQCAQFQNRTQKLHYSMLNMKHGLHRFANATRQRTAILQRRLVNSTGNGDKDPHSSQRHWWARYSLPANPFNVALSGFVGGLFGGPLGVGGGTIMIPMLRQLTRLNAQQTAGSSIFAVSIGATWAAMNYLEHGFVREPIAITLGLSSIIFAWMGASVAAAISSVALTRATGLALTASIPFVLFKLRTDPIDSSNDDAKSNIARGWLSAEPVPRSARQSTPIIENSNNSNSIVDDSIVDVAASKPSVRSALLDPDTQEAHDKDLELWQADWRAWLKKNWRFVAVGAVAGLGAGMIGVGGGIFWTAYMSAFTDLSQKEAVATSIVAIIPASIVSALTHFRYGHIQLPFGLLLALMCSAGMYISSEFAMHIPDLYLRVGFVILLASTGLRMLVL